jgi:predicted enzyme related to lactoylglutathione lyase
MVPSQVAHFSINAENVERAQQFYAEVFEWEFEAFGPPGFYMVKQIPNGTDPAPVLGSLQGRREIVPGVRMTGFECTIAVENIDSTIKAIETNGGRIVLPKSTLPSIGHLCFFEDTEGNIAGAMQYDSRAE